MPIRVKPAYAHEKLNKGYQILISCCLLASLCLASPIAPVKSVGDNDESPDQLSQSLNLTLDSTEEVGLITSETTSGEFRSLPVTFLTNFDHSSKIIDDFSNRSRSFIKTEAKSERSKRSR